MIKDRIIIITVQVLITCFVSVDSFAQQRSNLSKHDQYRPFQLTMENGLSFNSTNVMIKDLKGFLWVGSKLGGFCRFDGASFKKYIPEQNKPGIINSDKIISFTEDSLNNIWIGTDKGMSKYDIKADTFTNFSPLIDSLFSNSFIYPLCATKDKIFCMEPGSLITSININTLKREKLVMFSKENNPGVNEWASSHSFFDEATMSVWFLPMNGEKLVQIFLNNGESKDHLWPCYRKDVTHRHSAEDMKYDAQRNSLWLNSGDGLLEFSLGNQQFRKIEGLNELTKFKDYDRGVGMDIDEHGKVLFSTNSGILIHDPKNNQVYHLFSDPGLQDKIGLGILQVYCDRDGIVWTSTGLNNGIYEILPSTPTFERFTANPKIKDSLSNHSIHSIIPTTSEIWIGTKDGLNIFDIKTGKFNVLRQKDLAGSSGNFIVPVHIDTLQQKAWIRSTTSGHEFNMDLYEMDLKTKKCKPVIFRDGAKRLDTFSIASEWFKPYKKGLLFCDENHGIFEIKENSPFADLLIPFQSYTSVGRMVLVEDEFIFLQHGGELPNFCFANKNGQWTRISHPLDSLIWFSIFYNKMDQTYWVGFKYELTHYNKNFQKIKTYRQEDGYNAAALNFVTDNNGNLWFNNMLGQINRLDTTLGIITTISEADGYKKQNFFWFEPVAKDIEGHLYFGAGNPGIANGGLDRIYPERYSSVVTSSIYLRSLTINQKPFSFSTGINDLDELSLRYNQNTISIETGIIDYYAKGKGHIRYKLIRDDQDEEWQYGPAYYTIRYEKLPHGSYKLILQSSNVGNEFNSSEKILTIHISPPFWQTWWFRTIAIVVILLAFYGIYRWRTAVLRRQKRKLEQTVKERTAEVVEEKAEVEKQKAKSDELLLNILPTEVAEELKEKGYTTAKSFDEVTILFSDIKGFTNVAERMTAQELVKEIDTYFSSFDRIMQQFGLEKIKTIGDAYIAAGGLPEENTATAQKVIEAAIAMQQVVEKLKRERIEKKQPYFELRIGIHTGPVVAGVVGIKKFQYDIWGDTVNLAARMEQSGIPGKINISRHTYELVKEQFTCVHRGKIEAKNKGEIDMYFVEQN